MPGHVYGQQCISANQSTLSVSPKKHRTMPESDAGMVVMLPGFTEDPAFGTAKALHEAVADEYPERDVVSICSDGYNQDGSPLKLHDLGRTFEDMALARLNITSALSAGAPVLQNGVSKGTVLSHHVAQHNTAMNLVSMEGLIYHSPAIVSPKNILKDMVVRFTFGHIALEPMREALHQESKVQGIRTVLKSFHIPSLKDAPPYICDIINLLHGTPEHEVDELLKNGHQIGVIAGGIDPLAQLAMWDRLQEKHPDKLDINVKEGRGHGASMNAVEAAKDIRQSADKILGRSAVIATSSL